MALSRGLGVPRCFPTSGFRCHYETLFYVTVSLSPHVIARHPELAEGVPKQSPGGFLLPQSLPHARQGEWQQA